METLTATAQACSQSIIQYENAGNHVLPQPGIVERQRSTLHPLGAADAPSGGCHGHPASFVAPPTSGEGLHLLGQHKHHAQVSLQVSSSPSLTALLIPQDERCLQRETLGILRKLKMDPAGPWQDKKQGQILSPTSGQDLLFQCTLWTTGPDRCVPVSLDNCTGASMTDHNTPSPPSASGADLPHLRGGMATAVKMNKSQCQREQLSPNPSKTKLPKGLMCIFSAVLA